MTTPSAYSSDGSLVLAHVGRRFEPAGVDALRNVSLCIQPNESLAVVGRSGAGKSTLLNLLGLLDFPTTGEYSVDGFKTTLLPETELTLLRATFFGFVFQKAHLLKHRTVLENVELPLIPRTANRRLRRDQAREAIERVGLSHRRDAFPGTLSGGEAQRVAIARAIAQTPKVLLCDEPTGNLDQTTGRHVLDLFSQLHDELGLAVVICTHDMKIAESQPRRLEVSDGTVTDHRVTEVAI